MRFLVSLILLANVCVAYQGDSDSFYQAVVPQETLTVACKEFPSVVEKNGNQYEGFLIDLFERIAGINGWQFEYVEGDESHPEATDHYEGAFTSLKTGKSDVLLSAITKTAARENEIDFSDQYMRSGLRILKLKEDAPWYSFALGFMSPAIGKSFIILTLLLSISGFFLWFFDRKAADSEVKNYTLGFQLAFETASTIGHGFLHPKTLGARVTGWVTFLAGAICFANLMGELSAEKVTQKMNTSIQSPSDLDGKRVATVRGTTSTASCSGYGAIVHEHNKFSDACLQMMVGSVDAVVYDWPAIASFMDSGSTAERCEVAGPLFDIQYYGVAFASESPLTEPFNVALHGLRETGEYDEIYNKWFPDKNP